MQHTAQSGERVRPVHLGGEGWERPQQHRRPQAEPLQNLRTGRHGPGCPGRPRLTREASDRIPWARRRRHLQRNPTLPPAHAAGRPCPPPQPPAPALEAGSPRRSADRLWRHVSARPSACTRGQAQRQRDGRAQTETPLHGARRVGGRLSWGPVPPPRPGTGGRSPQPAGPRSFAPGRAPFLRGLAAPPCGPGPGTGAAVRVCS